jgi:drug/metabolite transporter (DMT)-like permease
MNSTSRLSHLPLGLHYACLAASMALVGSYVTLSQELVAVMGVTVLAWCRFTIGALAMPHWLRKPADEPPLTPALHGWLFLESLLGNVLFSLCMLAGVQRTSAVSAGVILSFTPMAVALLSRWWLGEHVAGRTWGGIALAVCGMGLLSLEGRMTTPEGEGTAWSDRALGNVLILAAVVCEASYAVIGKRLTLTLSPRRITALINLWGWALMTPLAWTALQTFEPAALHLGHWSALLFYALAASVGTVWLWMTGLQRVPASQAGVFTAMLPVAACTVAWALGEAPSPLQWLALGLTLAGIAVSNWMRPAGG